MKEYLECPCCNNWSIAVIDGKIVRHETGLGYIPYRFYHGVERRSGRSVREQMQKNICHASGKTIDEAKEFYLQLKKEEK